MRDPSRFARAGVSGAALALGCLHVASAEAIPVRAPYACPQVQPIPHALGITSRYSADDPTQSDLDDDLVAAQAPVRRRIDQPTVKILALADLYRTAPAGQREAVALCLGGHFAALAKNGSLEGARSNADDFYRDWIVATLAIAYLKAQDALNGYETAPSVHRWFGRHADALRAFHAARAAAGRINNHHYWGGLAVAAVGIVNRDRGHIAFGEDVLRTGLGLVDQRGMLAAELGRGKRARHYHLFAAEPLAALALLTKVRLSRSEEEAMRRLIGTTVQSLEAADGGAIAGAAGISQIPEGKLGGVFVLTPFAADTPLLADALARLTRGIKPYAYFLGGRQDVFLQLWTRQADQSR